MRVWTGFSWLRTGTRGGLLWTRQWTFGFHRRQGSFWKDELLSDSQEGLSSIEL